jgi:hypothetical protein
LLGVPQKGGAPLPLDSTRRAAAGDTPVTPKTPYEDLSNSMIIPQEFESASQIKYRRSWRQYVLNILTLGLRRDERDEELSTSIYYQLLTQEKRARRWYILYDMVTYTCMILQLIVASVLIIIGARGGDDHLVVSILGAVTGLLTGILSLIKGQGYPNRLLQYGDSLRRVREDIEFTERELRAGRRIVTYGEVMGLRRTYELVREDESKNRPDVWSTGLAPNVGKGDVGVPVAKSVQPKTVDRMV